jgi:HlyD family secretion protein
MPALLENWGGDQPLQARVRLVEPYGYTKVSALGVEEQRVNVILDLVDPPGRLGDGFRVDARIIIWESPDVLKVPASAVFRHGDGLAVFVVDGDRAHRRVVTAGQRGPFDVEILAGLTEGERLILYPPPGLDDGARIVALGH